MKPISDQHLSWADHLDIQFDRVARHPTVLRAVSYSINHSVAGLLWVKDQQKRNSALRAQLKIGYRTNAKKLSQAFASTHELFKIK